MKKLILILLALVGTAQAQARHFETKYVTVTPTVTAGAYVAGDSVGDLMTFTNITCSNMQKGQITSVQVTDKSDNAVEYNLVMFKSLPAGTFTNDAAFDPADADLLLMLPVINLATTDHFSFNDNGISSLASLFSNGQGYSTTSLPGIIYASLVTEGTPTYGSTSDISVILGFRCD